ncbi:proline-rich protein 18 [Rhinophrynus dorsalis]
MASMGTQHQQQDAMLHPARRFIQQVPKGITRSYESVMHPHTATLNRTRRGLAGDLRRSSKVQQEMLGQQHTPLQQHQPPTPQKPRHQQQVITASPQPLDVHFSLCLTPEAILVIQKRNLEKQLLQQQRNTNTKRIFASSRGWGPRDRGDVSHRLPPQKTAPPDVRELVKISLLNDQHRYDDVEYEEDEIWMMRDGGQGYILDEALVRRCTEWLQGVEMATTRDRTLTDKLQTLPHLNTY